MDTTPPYSEAIARSLGLIADDWLPRPAPPAKKRRKYGPRDARTSPLREMTSQLDYGKKIYDRKTDGWHPVHCNSGDCIKAALNSPQTRFLKRVTNRNFADHFADRETYYFAGQEDHRHPDTLVMIDVDCKKVGTLQGAIDYGERLKAEFPGIYYEVSTHGKGGHGYLILEKQGWSPSQLNDLLKTKLQPFLNELAKGFDVEFVEVKGTMPIIRREKGQVLTVTCGQLAKLPRNATLEQLKNTARITPIWLDSLPEFKKEKKPAIPSAIRKPSGSCGGKCISEDEIADLDDHYTEVAARLIGQNKIGIDNEHSRATVTTKDVAIWLMIAKFFTNNMNEDGSMPWARFKRMWQALYKSGDIDRAWSTDRNKAIRNYLFDLGWCCDVEDNRYYPGSQDVEGKAAKWRLSAKLMAMLECSSIIEERKERETTLATTGHLDGLGIRLVCVFRLVSEREQLAILENRATELLDQAVFAQYSTAC